MTGRPAHTLVVISVTVAIFSCVVTPSHAAWPDDPNLNVALCTAAGNQTNAAAISDGAGGMIVAWEDRRAGVFADIYAQRVLADGSIAPGWPADGVAVRVIGGNQLWPSLVSDGAGGAIITWEDGPASSNVFASRITAAGTLAAGWTANGTPVGDDFFDLTSERPSIIPDGAGGAFIAWDSGSGAQVQRVTDAGSVAAGWPAEGLALTTGIPLASPGIGLAPDAAGGGYATWCDFRNGFDADIIAQRFTGAGAIAAGWPADGVTLCGVADSQVLPVSVSDGAGGAVTAWWDFRGSVLGIGDIYAQRVLPTGAVDPFWPGGGVAVCAVADNQGPPQIVSDQTGGALFAWTDARLAPPGFGVYAQHLTATGGLAAGWPMDGLQVSSPAADTVANFRLLGDGAGGLVVAWNDDRSGLIGADIFAVRVTGAGVPATGWMVGGSAISTAAGYQTIPTLAGDAATGFLAAWQDQRAGIGAAPDIYSQRVDRWGRRGNSEPGILSVRDVTNDQGGRVVIRWSPSYLDPDPFFEIGEYWIWRQVPGAAAEQMIHRGAREYRLDRGAPRPAQGDIALIAQAQQEYYWEFLAAQPASGLDGYSYVAETTSDSTAAGNPYTAFMVQARHTSTIANWSSTPDSGYSVDNVSPAPPAAFSAQYFAGPPPSPAFDAASPNYIWFHWSPGGENDLLEYRLHRGASSGFVPSPANLVVAKPDTGFILTNRTPGDHYKLLTVDVHGNASAAATLAPTEIVGVEETTLPASVRLAPPWPNPVTDRGQISFELPRQTPVSLALFDARGRRVRELAGGTWPAGRHALVWDRRGEDGRLVASGVYWLRLDGDGQRLTVRMAVLR